MQQVFITRVASQSRTGSPSLDKSTGVDAVTGNFVLDRTDASVASPSGLLVVQRTYNSVMLRQGAFGVGWTAPRSACR